MAGRSIHVRVAVPAREELRKKALAFARDPRFPFERPQEFLRSYIQSRQEDIGKQRRELAKARVRIARHAECVQLAKALIEEFDGDDADT